MNLPYNALCHDVYARYAACNHCLPLQILGPMTFFSTGISHGVRRDVGSCVLYFERTYSLPRDQDFERHAHSRSNNREGCSDERGIPTASIGKRNDNDEAENSSIEAV